MAPASPPRLRWLLALLPLLTLTGCFDVLEELWLEPDGSARLVVDLTLPKSLSALSQLTGGRDVMAEIRAKRTEAEAEIRKDPNVTELVLRDSEVNGQVHFVYDVSVRDATKLPELYRKILQQTASDAQQLPAGDWDFRLEREGGDYVFTRRFVPAGPAADSDDPAEQATREIAKGMVRALFAGHHYRVIVHGPGILETNGTVNEKKDTVEWKLALAELVDVPAEGRELRAVVSGGEPLWLWPVVIGVPLAVLGLAIAAARRQRATSAR